MNNNAYLTLRALIHNWESRESKDKSKNLQEKQKSPKTQTSKN